MNVAASILPLLGDVFRLDGPAIAGYALRDGSGQLALTVAILAGSSEAIGNSVVLFINRVTTVRFFLTLLVRGVIFAVTYVFWSLSLLFIATAVFGVSTTFTLVVQLVAFSLAPRTLGFLEFIPVFGRPIGIILRLWGILALLVVTGFTLGLQPWQALVSVGLGAVVHIVLENTVGRPLRWLGSWFERKAAGVRLVRDHKHLDAIIKPPDPRE